MKIINGGNARYLGELKEFKKGLPHGVINKTKTDVGGTYIAANCDKNYIIVCPFRDLVDSIAADENNKYEVFKCYGGVRESAYKSYIKKHQAPYKVAVTYDSLPKLLKWIQEDTDRWSIVIDEYHMILEDMDYRSEAIDGLLDNIKKFSHYTFLSATPIDNEFEIPFIHSLPHYKVIWDNCQQITVKRIKATRLISGLTELINIFNSQGIRLPDIYGDLKEVEQLYIFINSVTSIKQIIETLDLDPTEVKICCADRMRNKLILDKYPIEPVCNPNKRINFFTKKCFQGCNLFTNNGLVIVASDAHRSNTLVGVSTTMEQIAGRIRVNKESQNIFRHIMVHLFSTNNHILSDEEFTAIMKSKEDDAKQLLSLQEKATPTECEALIKRVNVETDILSISHDRLVFNEQKRQSFIYKHKLQQCYKNGINLRACFDKSEKFIPTNQDTWTEFDIVVKKAFTVSYEQLLKDYLEHPNTQYEQEYPEFPLFRKYLTETEMNTCRWNKDKMLKMVNDRKLLNKAFKAIYQEDLFISDKDLKQKLVEQFKRLGISLSPKATLIKNCQLYEVKRCSDYSTKKKINGYKLGKLKLDFTF